MDQELNDNVTLSPESLQAEMMPLPTLWLTAEESIAFNEWKGQIQIVIPFWTVVFSAIHLLSMLVASVFGSKHSSMRAKDVPVFYNKVVSLVHAAVAFALGMYWIFVSDEPSQIGDRPFIFLPLNAHIAALGIGYFLYDFMAMIAWRKCMKPSFFWGIMVHHAIFIVAYWTTLVLPCSISVTTYHLFQLTELSTVFLHLLWMASKLQVQYVYLFSISMALLVTFFQRVLTTAFIVWTLLTTLWDQQLWTVNVPEAPQPALIAYIVFFVLGCTGMLFINFKWFTALIGKAKDMVKRVQNGQTPTPDYDRPVKAD